VLANPPREGWYPASRAVPCPRVMVWAPEVPPVPHPLARLGHLLPSYYQVPIDVTAAASLVYTRLYLIAG